MTAPSPTPPHRERRWKLDATGDDVLLLDPAGERVGFANSRVSGERLVERLNGLEKQVDDLEHALLWAIDSETPAGCAYCAQLLGGQDPPLCPAHRELEKLRKRPALVLEESKEISTTKRPRSTK